MAKKVAKYLKLAIRGGQARLSSPSAQTGIIFGGIK